MTIAQKRKSPAQGKAYIQKGCVASQYLGKSGQNSQGARAAGCGVSAAGFTESFVCILRGGEDTLASGPLKNAMEKRQQELSLNITKQRGDETPGKLCLLYS